MRIAVDRIRQAVDSGEKIAIYGDYDVDGVTASTLMNQLLLSLGADVQVYIPNRFDEGYGINSAALVEL
jgi:single-stranded-DNA-specific exonuclease